MSKKDKPTDASKVELTDEQLDTAEGGAGYIKFDGIDGESLNDDRITESISLNFGKIETTHEKGLTGRKRPGTKTIKW